MIIAKRIINDKVIFYRKAEEQIKVLKMTEVEKKKLESSVSHLFSSITNDVNNLLNLVKHLENEITPLVNANNKSYLLIC